MSVTICNPQRLLKVDRALLKQIARYALTDTGATDCDLSVVLVDDKRIAELNARYHHTEGPTDILSFNYGDGHGEIIISVERALAQARRFRSTPSRELTLYIIHGILHLTGYDDRTARQRSRMRAAERRLMARLRREFDLEVLTFGRRRTKPR